MKKTIFRKAISSVMIFVLIVALLSSNLQPLSVYAAKAGNNQKPGTTTEKPISKLEKKKLVEKELYAWAKEQEESKKAELTKKKFEKLEKTLNQVNTGVPMLISTIKDIADGDDFDTAALVTNLADLTSGILACFVPWGTVASIGLNIAETLFTTLMGGEEGPSETQLMEDRLNQRLDELADQISEVQEQLTDMSDQINASTEMIISSVSTAIENESDKNHLRDFMLSSGLGDFSYNQFRNYLYGSTSDNRNAMKAYYALLQEAQLQGGTSEEIKHYYDLLYSGLVDNRESFHDYITGDGFGKSIVATYYDVISVRPDLTEEMGMSAEMATIQFAYDLYQTEMMMDQLILACNNYQYTQMAIDGTDEYDYGTGTVLAKEILNDQYESVIAKSLMTGIDEMRMQFAKDLVYVLGITGSYAVEKDGQFDYHGTTEIDGVTYATVLENQTVYLNTIPATVCEQFDLDADAFTYSVRGLLDESGIVQVSYLNKNSVVSLTYTDADGTEYSVGSLRFTDGEYESFSGGDGTAESPYLISTPDQFLNIANGMDKHYRLLQDISFEDMQINPLGYGINTSGSEIYEEFTGVLDGNGYTVSGLKILGSSHSGIFGKIGSSGEVKNLNVSNVKVTVIISKADKSSTTFTGGVIAGTNNGTITSCVVSNSDVIVTSSTTNEDTERSVYFKYGGVVGVNNGSMTAVMVKNSTVDVSSTHDFGGAETAGNRNYVFAGGICGTCPGILSYACADKYVVVKAYTKSILNPNTTVNPYVKAYAGGITTSEGLKIDNISNICSEIPKDKVTAGLTIDVQSGWGEHYGNAEEKNAPLIPNISDEDLKNISVDSQTVQNAFGKKDQYRVVITDATEKYPVGALELNEEKLEIMVNGQKVENYQILNLYGFSTYNESFVSERNIEVIVLFEALVQNKHVILTGTLPITIDKNYVTDIDVINYDTVYFMGESVETVAMVEQWDAYGNMTTVVDAEIMVENGETATKSCGTQTLIISYKGVSCTVEIEVLCNVHYRNFDYNNPEHYSYVQTVTADCQHGGYEEYTCLGCNESVKTNRTGKVDHCKERDVSREATCAEPGVIGKIYCIYCGLVFEEQVELPRLAHNIVNVNDPNNHDCTLCGKSYAHDYVVSESLVDGKVTYTYSCHSCGYVGQKQDTNIITYEERLRPAVLVSDGYALKAGDLVTVYVDLENNPGVNGANFGIRYDERLELVQWYEGEFFAGTTTEASHSVSCGYNFVWATEAARNEKGGNLLELVFRLPEDATAEDAYSVSVVYSVVANSDGGFSLPNDVCASLEISADHPQKFKTKDGIIRIADRLPGDVDNNGVVNLLDALYLSRCLVNPAEYPITPEIEQYGDVNLVGGVTVDDVVKLLQSISGGYGASLLSPEYQIQLNTNGYTAYQPDPLNVQLYGENNTYAALVRIEQYMQQRQGYKFLGWYTRLEGGTKIDAENYQTLLVSYDADQKIQTLYAHWEKNTISFEMNDATSEWLEGESYLENGEQWIVLQAPVEEYTIIFVDPNNASTRQTEKMSRKFAYWQGSDGNKYYAGDSIPVHKMNMGQLTLTAQWEDWILNFPKLEKTGYDPAYITWYTNSHLTDMLDGNVYETIKALPEKVLYAEWTEPITYYVQYNANGGSGAVNNSEHKYDAAKELNVNGFVNEYYVTLDYGWDGQSNAAVKKSHIFQYWSRDGKNPVTDNLVSNWTAEAGKVITVYAVWDVQTVTLRDQTGMRPGYTFDGWYDQNGNFLGKELNHPVAGECTLYAKWTGNPYTIHFDGNRPEKATFGVENVPQDMLTANSKDVTLPAGPTLVGWTFDAWYDEADNFIGKAGQTLQCADLTTTDHITLYAKWQADGIKVKYDANGGSVDVTEDIKYFDHTYGEMPTPTRAGYVFGGWERDGVYVKSESVVGTTDEHTLVAKWASLSAYIELTDKNGYRNRSLSAGDKLEELINPKLDTVTLAAQGYTKIKVEVRFDAIVVQSCYQRVIAYSGVTGREFYGRDWDIAEGAWRTCSYSFTCDIKELQEGGKFLIRWECPDSWWGDQWNLGCTYITVTASK